MKRLIYLTLLVALASCSSSNYTAHFRKSNSDYGYGEMASPAQAAKPEDFVVSTSKESGIITDAEKASAVQDFKNKFSKLSKSEKKEFRKKLVNEVKMISKAKGAGKAYAPGVARAEAMDHDLRLAAIFGSVGVVGLLIGGNVFWLLGAIALIISVVFFVMWLTRQ